MDSKSINDEISPAQPHSEDCTTHRKTEDMLAKEYAIASTEIGITMADLEGTLFYVNEAFLKMRGIADIGDVLGKKILDFSNNKDVAADGLRAVKESGKWSADALVQRKDGSSFSEYIVANMVTNADGQPFCMMASFIDITEHTGTEEALRISEEKFRTLAELSPNVIYIIGKSGLLYVNRRSEEIAGSTRAEICTPGFDFLTLVAPEYRDIIKEVLKVHLNGNEVPPLEFALLTSEGARIDSILYTKLITYGGERAVMGTATDITRVKEAEKALKESEEQFRLISENSRDIICLHDSEHKYIYVSPACQEILGYDPEELIGTNPWELVHHQDLEVLSKLGREKVSKGIPVSLTYRIRKKSGEYVWFESVSQLIKGDRGTTLGFVTSSRDITDRKKTEEDLRQLNERLELAYEASGAGAWDWDITSGSIEWTPKMFELLGLDPCETKASFQAWESVLHKEDREVVTSQIYRALEECIPLSSESRVILPDGTIRWIKALGKGIYDDKNQPIRMVGICIDTSDQKKIEELKDSFIGMVSHEMKTPLTVINGSIHVVLNEEVSAEDRRELLENAGGAAENLADILENLLELSRHQANRLKVEKKATEIGKIINKIVDALKNKFSTHNISLDISEELPSVILDPERFERVLYNLVDNAVKYSLEGSEVVIQVRPGDGEVMVGVRDHGPGISTDDQETLFQPFQRLETRSEMKGIGLGLVVCKHLVEAHSGRIWVESKLGEGSIFYFTLPSTVSKDNL